MTNDMLDIDTAIKHCLEVAEQKEHDSITTTGDYELDIAMKEGCIQCAADHRQLAKWLMELKDARAALNDCGVEIEMLLGELREAKRLLKLALTAMNGRCIVKCYNCKHKENCSTHHFEWNHTDEVLKLLKGGENND